MWSKVGASLVLALALTACSDDSKDDRRSRGGGDDDPSGQPGDRDAGRGGPTGEVEPMSPACEALHGETVYQSDAFATVVRDGRASADGYVALLLDEQTATDAPFRSSLRIVRAPSGPVRSDVALPGTALALSDARAGRLSVLAGDPELLGPVSIASVDLASATVTSAAPLEDLSDAPRVHYDDAGQIVHQVASRALTVVRQDVASGASHIARLDDGAHAVLVFVSDPLPTQGQAMGAWLFVLEPDGRLRARVHVKTVREGFVGGVSLQRGPDDRLHVLTSVHRSERAGFERIHGRALQAASFERLPVLLTFSARGVLEDVHETAPAGCASPLDATATALDVDDAGLAWVGSCDGGARAWLATAEPAPDAPGNVTPLELGAKPRVGSVLRRKGAVFVAGARNFGEVAPGRPGAPGDALLARIEPDGRASLTCPYDTDRSDRFTLRRGERSLMILQYDTGLTDATGDDARAGTVVRYVAP
ncbi:MAG: hypothetical protein ABW252_18175 [Polyangiales bacterium]